MFIKIKASNRFLDKRELEESPTRPETDPLQFELLVQYSQINSIQHYPSLKQWGLRLSNGEWFATITNIVDIITTSGYVMNAERDIL
jgi:hypothetical protein